MDYWYNLGFDLGIMDFKNGTPSRIENLEITGFEVSADEMKEILSGYKDGYDVAEIGAFDKEIEYLEEQILGKDW